MIRIVDGTMLRCQECPNFIPAIDTTVFYADEKTSTTHVMVICEHHDLCKNIEKYLTEGCKNGKNRT